MIWVGGMFAIVGSLLAWSAIAQIKREEADPMLWRNAAVGVMAVIAGLLILTTELF